MKNLYLIFLSIFLFIGPQLSAQEDEKTNSIWFAEGFTGLFVGDQGGILYGGSLSYQFKRNLLTARYTENRDMGMAYFFIPIPITETLTDEIALLYGWRKIKNKHSLSFSAGPSYSWIKKIDHHEETETRTGAYGVAFEANIKWFPGKAEKAFQPGGGFKLSGNIADTYYIGLSIVLGLGNHRTY